MIVVGDVFARLPQGGGIGAAARLGIRVPVGVDVLIRSGWSVRYTFSEMISSNPIAGALSPPASGKLMNFQNLVGILKVF